MHPVTHGLAGWCLANHAPIDGRDRLLVTLGCVLPDLDGLGLVVGVVVADGESALDLFSRYHHALTHNLATCLIMTALCMLLARRKALTGLLFAMSFHLHLVMDVLGSRGPDGHQWPIPYLSPFDESWFWTWSGQWELASWQNLCLTAGLLLLTGVLARRRGFSFLESIWPRGDRELVRTLRQRFPLQGESPPHLPK